MREEDVKGVALFTYFGSYPSSEAAGPCQRDVLDLIFGIVRQVSSPSCK